MSPIKGIFNSIKQSTIQIKQDAFQIGEKAFSSACAIKNKISSIALTVFDHHRFRSEGIKLSALGIALGSKIYKFRDHNDPLGHTVEAVDLAVISTGVMVLIAGFTLSNRLEGGIRRKCSILLASIDAGLIANAYLKGTFISGSIAQNIFLIGILVIGGYNLTALTYPELDRKIQLLARPLVEKVQEIIIEKVQEIIRAVIRSEYFDSIEMLFEI